MSCRTVGKSDQALDRYMPRLDHELNFILLDWNEVNAASDKLPGIEHRSENSYKLTPNPHRVDSVKGV